MVVDVKSFLCLIVVDFKRTDIGIRGEGLDALEAKFLREEQFVVFYRHRVAHRQARYRVIEPIARDEDIVSRVEPVQKIL